MYACHVINSLSSSAIGGKTLMEVWFRKAAQDYDPLRIFGCTAYYHIKEDKLDPEAKKEFSLPLKEAQKVTKYETRKTRILF